MCVFDGVRLCKLCGCGTLWLAISLHSSSWPVGVALIPAALLRLRSTDLQSDKVTFHYNKSDALMK